jgi:hypothetical protein
MVLSFFAAETSTATNVVQQDLLEQFVSVDANTSGTSSPTALGSLVAYYLKRRRLAGMHANTYPCSTSMPAGAYVLLGRHRLNEFDSAEFHPPLRIGHDDNAFTNRIHPCPRPGSWSTLGALLPAGGANP